MKTLSFGQLPLGTAFEFDGNHYRKLAPGMAADDARCSNIFSGATLVLAEGEVPNTLPWKPDAIYWADRLCPAPGQKTEH